MRILVLAFLFISVVSAATAQTAQFNNTFTLRDGIYTSYQELLNNAPAFPDCILQPTSHRESDPDYVKVTRLNYYKAGDENTILKYTSPLFATVLKAKLNVYYQKELTSVYSKGTICTFIYTKDPVVQKIPNGSNYSNGSHQSSKVRSNYKSFVCLLDIQTGEIKKLTKEDLGMSIMRDSVLYQQFVKVKPGKKNKNLFKYIAEFNSRNPTLIPTSTDARIIEEE